MVDVTIAETRHESQLTHGVIDGEKLVISARTIPWKDACNTNSFQCLRARSGSRGSTPRSRRSSSRGSGRRGACNAARPRTTEGGARSARIVIFQRPVTVPSQPREDFIHRRDADMLNVPDSWKHEIGGSTKTDSDSLDPVFGIAADSLTSTGASFFVPVDSDAYVNALEPLCEEVACEDAITAPTSLETGAFEGESLSRGVRREVRPGEVPRLCGRCSPVAPYTSLVTYPAQQLHEDLRSSLDKCSVMFKEIRPEDAENYCMPEWFTDFDDIKLQPEREPSVFSRGQHRKLTMLRECDVFKLQCSTLQHKVKERMMLQEAQAQAASEKGIREMRYEFEASTVRFISRKPAEKRTDLENERLFKFFEKLIFFKNLPSNVLKDIIKLATFQISEKGACLYKKDDEVDGIYIMLKGRARVCDDVAESPVVQEPGKGSARPSLAQVPSPPVRRAISPRPKGKAANESWQIQPGQFGFAKEQEWDARLGAVVLNIWDLFQENVFPPIDLAYPEYSCTVQAVGELDVIYIPAQAVVTILQEHALQDRLRVLREQFPATKGKTDDDLLRLTRTERKGCRVRLHELFETSHVKCGTVLFQQGEKLSLDEAVITMILDGEAQLRTRTVVSDVITAGGLLGEEALHGDMYDHTASVRSPEGARILTITVADYVREFQGGRLRPHLRPRRPPLYHTRRYGRVGQETHGVDWYMSSLGDDVIFEEEEDAVGTHVSPKVRGKLTGGAYLPHIAPRADGTQVPSLIPSRIGLDAQRVREMEWKRIPLKKLPPRVAPPAPLPLKLARRQSLSERLRHYDRNHRQRKMLPIVQADLAMSAKEFYTSEKAINEIEARLLQTDGYQFIADAVEPNAASCFINVISADDDCDVREIVLPPIVPSLFTDLKPPPPVNCRLPPQRRFRANVDRSCAPHTQSNFFRCIEPAKPAL